MKMMWNVTMGIAGILGLALTGCSKQPAAAPSTKPSAEAVAQVNESDEVRELRALAREGNVTAQSYLGRKLMTGDGIEKNVA